MPAVKKDTSLSPPQEWTHICREWTIKAGDIHGFSSCYKQHRCIMAVVSPPVIGCASHGLSMSWSTENVAAKWGGGNQTGKKKKVKWGLLWHNDSSIGTRSLESPMGYTASVFSCPFVNVIDKAEMPGFVYFLAVACPAAEQKELFT